MVLIGKGKKVWEGRASISNWARIVQVRGVVYNCFDSCMMYCDLYELNCMNPISNYVVSSKFWVFAQKPLGRHECAATRHISFCPAFWVLLWTAWQRWTSAKRPYVVLGSNCCVLCGSHCDFWKIGCINHIGWFTIMILIIFVHVLTLWENREW